MIKFERLVSLPNTTEPVRSFPSEGIRDRQAIIRFFPARAQTWIGKFEIGLTEYDNLLAHPDGMNIVVIANGAGYVVNPETAALVHQMSDRIAFAENAPQLEAMVVGDGIFLEAIRAADGLWWRTRRISWDGMKDIAISGSTLTGKAYSPLDDEWHPFTVDLLSGEVQGGTYNGPPMN